MGALLQLERFDLGAEKPAPPPVFAQSDLEAAFAEGLAQGRQEAEAQRLGQICGALAALSERLAAESAARAASAEDQLRAIAPLIGALLDGIIPAVARGRLEAALLAELRQLAASVTPLAATIRCGPDMAAFVSACLAATGIEAIGIDPSGPEGTVEAEMLEGLATWSVAQAAGQLRDLVCEMMEME